MSTSLELDSIKNHIYILSRSKDEEEVDHYISSRISELSDAKKFEIIDNIFYTLDITKIHSDMAYKLLYFSKSIRSNLVFRNYFLDCCKKQFPATKDHFRGL